MRNSTPLPPARDNSIVPLITGSVSWILPSSVDQHGKAAVPGPFGAGKTVVKTRSRWSNADIVIFVGCGERGNELADAPRPSCCRIRWTGRSLMERTLLVANTPTCRWWRNRGPSMSASPWRSTHRDQGYGMVMLADSTRRWAEALREVLGRPARCCGGRTPAYLASRPLFTSAWGRVFERRRPARAALITLIGTVSPSRRRLLRAGDRAHQGDHPDLLGRFPRTGDARHYPAIDWVNNRSSHVGVAAGVVARTGGGGSSAGPRRCSLGTRNSRIVNLVGPGGARPQQRWGALRQRT